MDKQYFEDEEQKGWENLKKFQDEYGIFDYIEREKKGWYSDATGYTTNKFGERRNFNIEIKNRNLNLMDSGQISGVTEYGKPFFDDTVMIENHKVADLLFDNIIGKEPLYFNFLLDGSVIIFNLNKLTKRPLIKNEQKIKSRGYGKIEMAKREYLYIYDAAIYKDGKLVKKSGEDFI